MGIKKITITEAMCDECKTTILIEEGPYIDAMSYGCAFHVSCFRRMSTDKLVQHLNLDDIDIVHGGASERYVRHLRKCH